MEDITVKRGDESIMLCTADTEALACVFQSPTGQSFSMLKGAKYEDRIEQYGLKKEDCGLRITSVQDADNGLWTCTVTGKGVSGNFETGNGKIQVIVAIPPTTVHLEQDGQIVNGKINLNLDSGKQTFVDCVASGSRPAPEFNWYIGNEKIRANAVNSEATDDNGDIKYMSKLEYNADPKHNGQQLKCEVEHMGYSLQQITDQENFAEADLDLQFKPEEGGKAPEVFYGMQEGTEETIRIKFKANPKPTVGTWKIGETTVPIGASSVDSKFSSSQVNPAELQGDYQVELTFNMEEKLAGKPYTLEVTNDHGTTQYTFQLKLGEAPPPNGDGRSPVVPIDLESANAPVIGIVILVVIIILIAGITILARAKSMLCFKAKSGEPLEEEKEAFDDPEKGKLAEEPVKATPDKKPAEITETKKPETEDNKEEKKSNGAHTPV